MTIEEIMARMEQLVAEWARISQAYEALSNDLFEMYLTNENIPQKLMDQLKEFGRKVLAIFNELANMKRELQKRIGAENMKQGCTALINQMANAGQDVALIRQYRDAINQVIDAHQGTNQALEQALVDAMVNCETLLRQLRMEYQLALSGQK